MITTGPAGPPGAGDPGGPEVITVSVLRSEWAEVQAALQARLEV